MHIPDKWLIIKIVSDDGISHYKVFGVWMGGYLGGDSWRMSSAIVEITKEDKAFTLHTQSGSSYKCREDGYGTSGYGSSIIDPVIKSAGDNCHIMDESTDWCNLSLNK